MRRRVRRSQAFDRPQRQPRLSPLRLPHPTSVRRILPRRASPRNSERTSARLPTQPSSTNPIRATQPPEPAKEPHAQVEPRRRACRAVSCRGGRDHVCRVRVLAQARSAPGAPWHVRAPRGGHPSRRAGYSRTPAVRGSLGAERDLPGRASLRPAARVLSRLRPRGSCRRSGRAPRAPARAGWGRLRLPQARRRHDACGHARRGRARPRGHRLRPSSLLPGRPRVRARRRSHEPPAHRYRRRPRLPAVRSCREVL